MSAFPKLTVTDDGLALISAAKAADTIHFTSAHFGDGQTADGPALWQHYTGMVSDRLSVRIVESRRPELSEFATLTFHVSSTEIEQGFIACELGIYAAGDDGVEKLYAYANAGDRSDWFGDKATPESSTYESELYVGNGTSVEVRVNPDGWLDIIRYRRDMAALKALLMSRMDSFEAGVNANMDGFMAAANGKVKALGDRVDAIDILGAEVTVTASAESGSEPTAKAYCGGGKLISQLPGLAAGTYALGELLKKLMSLTHRHEAVNLGNVAAGNCPVYNCADCHQCGQCRWVNC